MEMEGIEILETQGITMQLEGLVTFAKPYSVKEGGTTNEGVAINFLMTKSFDACISSKDQSMGYKFSKSSIPLDKRHKLKAVPGFYDMKCVMGVGSNGKPELKPIDLELKQLCKLEFLDLPKENSETGETPPPASGNQKSGNGKNK